MQKREISSEDVVAFCTRNTIDTIIPILGATFLGAKISNLEPCLTEFQIKHLLGLIHPKIIFVEDDSISKIEQVLSSFEDRPTIIRYSSLNQFKKSKEDRNNFAPVSVPLDKTAIILFSSGTSGSPKGICHSHKSALRLGHTAISYTDVDCNYTTKKVLHVSRFYWITAVCTMLTTIRTGSCRVFCPNTPKDIFRTIEKYQVC